MRVDKRQIECERVKESVGGRVRDRKENREKERGRHEKR